MSTVVEMTPKKKARKARANAARPGSIAADHHITIESEPKGRTVYADEDPKTSPAGRRLIDLIELFGFEELAQMPVVIRKTSRGRRVRVWRAPNGSWHREAGGIVLKMHNGRKSFVITMYKGANKADLLNLIKAVDDVVEQGKRQKRWERVIEAWADESTCRLVFNSRRYVDPFVHADNSPKVFFCDESRCMETWHTEEESFHTLDHVEKEVGKYASYTVEVNRNATTPDSPWFVDLMITEFSEATPAQVASLVNDLQWAAEECRRANEANVATDEASA